MTRTTIYKSTFSLGGDRIVNRMGYGAMRITGDGIWGPPKDKAEAIKVLQRCTDLSINFIDTADSYGPDVSEELIAEALHPYPHDLVVATKGGLTRSGPNQWHVNAHPDHLQRALEGSLKKLKVDSIDLYQLHRVDEKLPYERTLEFMQRAQEEGLVKHLGLSEVSVEQVKKAQQYFRVVSVQNRYSIDNREWEPVLKYCEEHDIAFIPWYPLGGGNITMMETLKRVGDKYAATPQQVALSWLLHHSPNILLIPGTSKVKHLEENHKALAVMLTMEDLEELENLKG